MQQASTHPETCPVLRTADIISGKWTLLILRDLSAGINRFSALERSLVGISPKTLSERLKALEKSAIVTRKSFAEVPPGSSTRSPRWAGISSPSSSTCASTEAKWLQTAVSSIWR